ncbi:hypothetical protein Hanom_Chr17g01532221 [Helianthus anomalus]
MNRWSRRNTKVLHRLPLRRHWSRWMSKQGEKDGTGGMSRE